jgi:hypothetical protein
MNEDQATKLIIELRHIGNLLDIMTFAIGILVIFAFIRVVSR